MTHLLAHTSVQQLKGVGAALAEKLAKLGLTTLQDMMFHLPRDYEDRSHISPICAAHAGATLMLEGEVLAADVAKGKRQSLAVRFSDGAQLPYVFITFIHSKKSIFNVAHGCVSSVKFV